MSINLNNYTFWRDPNITADLKILNALAQPFVNDKAGLNVSLICKHSGIKRTRVWQLIPELLKNGEIKEIEGTKKHYYATKLAKDRLKSFEAGKKLERSTHVDEVSGNNYRIASFMNMKNNPSKELADEITDIVKRDICKLQNNSSFQKALGTVTIQVDFSIPAEISAPGAPCAADNKKERRPGAQ